MKFTKRALAAVLSAAMMTCAFAGCGDSAASSVTAASGEAAASTAAATGDKVVKIGVYEPASGDNGAGGKQETLGIQYANKVQPTVEIGARTVSYSGNCFARRVISVRSAASVVLPASSCWAAVVMSSFVLSFFGSVVKWPQLPA